MRAARPDLAFGWGCRLYEHAAIPPRRPLQLFVDGSGTPLATRSTAGADKGDEVWRVSLESPARVVKVRAAGEGLVRVYGVALERGGKGGVQLDALGILGMRARRWLNADADHLTAQVKAREVTRIASSDRRGPRRVR